MKMTKTTIKNLLNADYMDALAGFAAYLAEKKDMESALYRLDEKVWEIASDLDLTDEWLRIYSALMIAAE